MQLSSLYSSLANTRDPFKKAFLLARWALIIVCSYMIVLTDSLTVTPIWAYLFVALLIVSNVVLHYIPEATIAKSAFYSMVGVVDIVLVTLALTISQQTGTDFYMMYFLILIIAALSRELKWILISTVLVMVLYGLSLVSITYDKAVTDPAMLLRFPFFFIIAIFYGYMVQSVRKEKIEREKLVQEEVNRLKARFLGLITHGLLGPMNVITGYIHLMLTGASGDLTLEQIRIVDHLQLNAERLVRLIQELVELSNIDAKRVTLQIQKAEIKPLLEEVQREILEQPLAVAAGVEVIADDAVGPIETDWRVLRQAFLHIVANAIKADPSGPVMVIAGRGSSADHAMVAVMDSGVKIKKEEIGKILSRFSNAVASHNDEAASVGLRLAIAKNLVDLLGGTTQIRTGGSKSAEVVVSLPISWSGQPKDAVEINFVERAPIHSDPG